MGLHEERKKAGFTQAKLAEVSGVNIRNIQQYEIEKRDVNGASLDTLCRLATTIGCKISDIITDAKIKEMLKDCT